MDIGECSQRASAMIIVRFCVNMIIRLNHNESENMMKYDILIKIINWKNLMLEKDKYILFIIMKNRLKGMLQEN